MGDCIRRVVVVNDPIGLHLRPAATLADASGSFGARVMIWYQDRVAHGESPLEILALGAAAGARLVLEACGPDAKEASRRSPASSTADEDDNVRRSGHAIAPPDDNGVGRGHEARRFSFWTFDRE